MHLNACQVLDAIQSSVHDDECFKIEKIQEQWIGNSSKLKVNM